MIAETVVDERARELGLGIADAEIARRVTDDPNFKGIAGQFDRMRFEAILRNIGTRSGASWPSSAAARLRQQLLGTIGGEITTPEERA